MENTMYQLQEGACAIVTSLEIEGGIRRRLQDLGLIEGTKIECLKRSPAGDPIAYLIRGAVIALRREESFRILIKHI